MRLSLITGLFGSGKTSIINYLVKMIAREYNKKTALIINEEGEVKPDGNVPLKFLPRGCIPCETATYFAQLLTDLYRKESPDIVIVEPSGTTMPWAILSASEYSQEEAGFKFEYSPVINVLDPTRLRVFSSTMGSIVENGIKSSGCVVINKTDLALKEDIKKAEEIVKKIKPGVPILYTSAKTNAGLDELGRVLVEKKVREEA